MKLIRFSLGLILILFFSHNLSAAKDPTAEEIIKKVQKKVENVPLVFARFEQSFEWSIAGETQKYEGEIYIGKNENFRIKTPEQLIVSDGKSVWTQDNINKQVIIDHLDKSQDAFLPSQLFVRFHKDYKASVVKSENVSGKACYHLELLPKNKDVYIQRLDVWVDKDTWLTKKVSYLDANDNVTTYLINKLELRKEVDKQLFQYIPEAGLEVIDMR